jgi:hypothetical protein
LASTSGPRYFPLSAMSIALRHFGLERVRGCDSWLSLTEERQPGLQSSPAHLLVRTSSNRVPPRRRSGAYSGCGSARTSFVTERKVYRTNGFRKAIRHISVPPSSCSLIYVKSVTTRRYLSRNIEARNLDTTIEFWRLPWQADKSALAEAGECTLERHEQKAAQKRGRAAVAPARPLGNKQIPIGY